ncbi:MAG: peptide ligase PGM1-related protein [Nocardioidaceae bacterium]
MDPDVAYAQLQSRLARAWRPDLLTSREPRVVIMMPSFSMAPALLAHYAERIPALEQRDLYSVLLLANPSLRVVYLSVRRIPEYLVDYVVSLVPSLDLADVHRRLALITVDDASPPSLAAKLLDRPDLLARVRDFVGSDPAMIEPWNVTQAERDVAIALGIPLHGSHPRLLALGSKSGSRRTFAQAGVPHPAGANSVTCPADIVQAAITLRRTDPQLSALVVKLDNSAAGDGNVVVDLRGLPTSGISAERAALESRLLALPDWYVPALEAEGAIAEALIQGDDYRSPSVQLTVTPDGDTEVLSTHDQILGGESGQVYEGCRFPADEAYAGQIAEYGLRIGRQLASEGVIGRFGVDFATVRQGAGWESYALEINLRKGGTTHPFGTAQLLLHGEYDARAGTYRDDSGQPRYYVSTDNLLDPRWRTMDPQEVIRRVDQAGLAWDPSRRTGVAVHMLGCLPIDGRFGFTAFGATRAEAEDLYAAVPPSLA